MAGLLISGDIGKPPAPPEHGDFGGGGGRPDWGGSRRSALTGVVALAVASSMTFLALACVFVLRRGLGGEWSAVPLPRVLWVNTLVLLLSSAFLEWALAALRGGRRGAFNIGWTAGALLGALFLVGQAVAWREVALAGFHAMPSAAVAFFYLLTLLHGVHVLGGMSVLVWVDVKALKYELGPARRTTAQASAVFWHFLTGVWVCLLLLLAV